MYKNFKDYTVEDLQMESEICDNRKILLLINEIIKCKKDIEELGKLKRQKIDNIYTSNLIDGLSEMKNIQENPDAISIHSIEKTQELLKTQVEKDVSNNKLMERLNVELSFRTNKIMTKLQKPYADNSRVDAVMNVADINNLDCISVDNFCSPHIAKKKHRKNNVT